MEDAEAPSFAPSVTLEVTMMTPAARFDNASGDRSTNQDQQE
jgi:hypothetical protein